MLSNLTLSSVTAAVVAGLCWWVHACWSPRHIVPSPASDATTPPPSTPVTPPADVVCEGYLVLTVMPMPEETFAGHVLQAACDALGLQRTTQGLFHGQLPSASSGASTAMTLASVMEPGAFPENMDRATCPGLVLFSDAGDCVEQLERFEAMLLVAHALTDVLSGQLGDGHRRAMNPAQVQALRENLLRRASAGEPC